MTIQAGRYHKRKIRDLLWLTRAIGATARQRVTSGMANLPSLALAAVLVSASAMAHPFATWSDADYLAAAMMACQSDFAGDGVFCDLGGDKTCHYQWTLPACAIIEQRYNAPDGPAASARAEQKRARDRARELIERLAK